MLLFVTIETCIEQEAYKITQLTVKGWDFLKKGYLLWTSVDFFLKKNLSHTTVTQMLSLSFSSAT